MTAGWGFTFDSTNQQFYGGCFKIQLTWLHPQTASAPPITPRFAHFEGFSVSAKATYFELQVALHKYMPDVTKTPILFQTVSGINRNNNL